MTSLVVIPVFQLQKSKMFMFYSHKIQTIRREVVVVSAHKFLRSKITFVKLEIYSSFDRNSCELNVEIHSATRFLDDMQTSSFCGIYHNFTFYVDRHQTHRHLQTPPGGMAKYQILVDNPPLGGPTLISTAKSRWHLSGTQKAKPECFDQ